MSAILRASGVFAAYNRREVLRSIDLQIDEGTAVCIVGPNGSGKSTLLKVLAGIHSPTAGTIELAGRPMHEHSRRQIARELAMLPQQPVSPDGVTVADLVEQGRYPHQGALRMLRRQDYDAVADALNATGMATLAQRQLNHLSGGERQRAWLALALAQTPQILLLDEPTTFLDIGHQLDVLELIEAMRLDRGLTVVLVLHDLNHAARYSDRIVIMKECLVVGDGRPRDVITSEMIAHVFGVDASIFYDPVTSAPVVIPYRAIRTGPSSQTGDNSGRKGKPYHER
jgi:iron complex transport system ATP-binding protein